MIRKLLIATTFIAASAGLAFAQSAPSPANTAGGNITNSTPAPTDQSAGGNQSGNVKGAPAGMTSERRSGHVGTTGMGPSPNPKSTQGEVQQKNASPASGQEGVEKEK